jgi:hypothetical protein
MALGIMGLGGVRPLFGMKLLLTLQKNFSLPNFGLSLSFENY